MPADRKVATDAAEQLKAAGVPLGRQAVVGARTLSGGRGDPSAVNSELGRAEGIGRRRNDPLRDESRFAGRRGCRQVVLFLQELPGEQYQRTISRMSWCEETFSHRLDRPQRTRVLPIPDSFSSMVSPARSPFGRGPETTAAS